MGRVLGAEQQITWRVQVLPAIGLRTPFHAGPDAVGDYRTHESYTAAAGRDSRVASVSSESEAEAGTQGPTLDSNNLHVLKYVDG